MSKATQDLTFTVPISFEAHAIAQQCSKGQLNSSKAEQVYLNTLAVYAVDFYLRYLGFETEWDKSDSRHPLMLKFMDVADLDVRGVGKIECRPVWSDQAVVQIPPEGMEERQAYVAVQFSPSLKSAEILGFTPKAAAEVPLNQLQSLSEFLVYLTELEQGKTEEKNQVNLWQWFEEIFDQGWQAVGELMSPQLRPAFMPLSPAFRKRKDEVQGVKLIDLGVDFKGHQVVLMITMAKTKAGATVQASLHPTGEQKTLPPHLKLIILTSSGEVFKEVTARSDDQFIRYKFEAELGDKFAVKVAMGEPSLTENLHL